MKLVAIWLLNDLRLRDHAALTQALLESPDALAFVYVWGAPHAAWDSYSYRPFIQAAQRMHPLRERFLIESLLDFAQAVAPAPLVVLEGSAPQALAEWVRTHQITAIYSHLEYAPEERRIQAAAQALLAAQGVPLHFVEGNQLYRQAQLPFAVENLPWLFTRFRQLVERHAVVESPLPAPSALPPWPHPLESKLPQLEARLRQLPESPGHRWRGGETAALTQLQAYLSGPVFTYKQTRNAFEGATFSSRLSPYLALGCLSPRTVYEELRKAERQRGANESTYWLFFELLWREYFRWLLLKEGQRFFRASGLRKLAMPWQEDKALFLAWCEGQTGYPIIDAAMRELKATGWTSNRARQIVASFLSKNLLLDWRWGASWFEYNLIDYDTASNWGNWLYQAGVGTDGRGFRWFDPLRQARLHDPQALFIKRWVPELASLPPAQAYFPDLAIRKRLGYPMPIVDWQASLRRAKEAWQKAVFGEPKGNRLLGLWTENE